MKKLSLIFKTKIECSEYDPNLNKQWYHKQYMNFKTKFTKLYPKN